MGYRLFRPRPVDVATAVLGAVLLSAASLSAQVVLQPVGMPMQHSVPGRIGALRFSPDSKKLLADKAHLWDVETTERIGLISMPLPRIRTTQPGADLTPDEVEFHPDSKTLIAISGIYFQRWDAAKGRPLAKEVQLVPLTALQSETFSGPISFRPDGKALLVHHHRSLVPKGGAKQEFKVLPKQGFLLNAATGQRVGSALAYEDKGKPGAQSSVQGCAYTPDGKQLITFHSSGQIRFWDGATGKRKELTLMHPEVSSRGLNVSPDGKTMTSVGRTAQLWDLTKGQAVGEPIKVRTDGPLSANLAFSPDGKTLALRGGRAQGNDIEVLDLATGKTLTTWRQPATIRELAYSPDGKALLTVAQDYSIVLWDPATGKELARVTEPTTGLPTAAFSPNGKRLATTTYHRPAPSKIHLWQLP